MVNESGNNGTDNGEGMSPLITEVNATNHVALEPSEEDLVAALQQYARERLTAEQRIMRLQKELNYRIWQVQMLMEHILLIDHIFCRHTKLKSLNKKYDIPTVRKPPPLPVATTLICEKLDQDQVMANGPNTIQTMLAVDDNLIPRCVTSALLVL